MMIIFETIKSQWQSWVPWVTSEKIYNVGVGVAIVFSILCFGAIVFILAYGIAMGETRDGGIAIKRYKKKKVLA